MVEWLFLNLTWKGNLSERSGGCLDQVDPWAALWGIILIILTGMGGPSLQWVTSFPKLVFRINLK